MLYRGPNNPQDCPLPAEGSQLNLIDGSFGPHESAPKRQLDLFSRSFFAQNIRETNTDKRTYTQTMLRATSVATDRVHALCACD